MKKAVIILSLFFLGASFSVQAQEMSQKEKSSYAIGLMLGDKIKSSGIDPGLIEAIKERIDFESLKEGIRDYFKGEYKLTKEEIGTNLAEIQKKIEYYKTIIDAKQSQENERENPLYTKLIKEAWTLYESKEYLMSGQKYAEAFVALEGEETSCYDRYNAACSWALANEIDSAFEQLFMIVNSGSYTNLEHLSTDPDLNSLHTDKRWTEIIEIVKLNKEKAKEKMSSSNKK